MPRFVGSSYDEDMYDFHKMQTVKSPRRKNESVDEFIERLKKQSSERRLKRENNQKKIKPLKESNIMKARSDLKKKGTTYSVDTEMNVKKGLEPKVKRALKKSVDMELERNFKGGSINLDYSSSDSESSDSDDENSKKKKKTIDKKELKNYAKMLSHLLEHIEDPKERVDKKDYRDSKKLISDMEVVKRGRGRPRKNS